MEESGEDAFDTGIVDDGAPDNGMADESAPDSGIADDGTEDWSGLRGLNWFPDRFIQYVLHLSLMKILRGYGASR
ncbi:MAG: hypothetical protein ACLR0U_21160 [Enterocloster clostridioformis]